ncbi:hypothetical protein CRE_20952 [Caenorhabditis remanei]|uniref:F-box domain-containing protein n=1 Tax=Caenorhabditis remanei TaxID=31234 RepID=E3NCQ9_CAERE|nr:hypothetical protein CRE_20952 [Caenorhabditis remanei]
MTTAYFPLFSLPYLAIQEVFDHFGPQGIINISLCSQRAKKLAISYRGPSKNVQLDLGFGAMDCLKHSDDMTIELLLKVEQISTLSKNRALSTVKIGEFSNIPVEMGVVCEQPCLKTYWEDRIVGLTEIGNYAREIFNQNIYKVLLWKEFAENDNRRALNWVMRTQQSLEFLHCEFTSKTDQDLDQVLESYKLTKNLTVFVKPSRDYRPAAMPHINIDSIYIFPSFWISQDHLLMMNCKYVILQDSVLTHQDMNVFLKHWKSGRCFELKEVYVTCEELIDYDSLLDDVDFIEMGKDVKRSYVK